MLFMLVNFTPKFTKKTTLMKKNFVISAVFVLFSNIAFAGGWLTNTNQNVAFLRNPARDGVIGIDGVYSNPAGVAFLGDGFHLSLNVQSAYQNRKVTSTFAPFAFGTANNGQSEKLFKGDAKAPLIPSVQAAYNRGRWSFSFNFAIGGGGGKCTFNNGLGSFECQASLLPLLGSSLGISEYSLESYMRGRQYYYGFQLGAANKITDELSIFLGGRLIYATSNYYGYMRNICVNDPNGNGMISATTFFSDQATTYSELVGQLTEVASNYAAVGDDAMAQYYTSQAEVVSNAAKQMTTLAKATEDISLNCDQSGWGFTPIIGLDYKIGKLNFGIKYEFKTKIRLENRSANSQSAERLESLSMYMDGRKIKQDIPALLTIGAQYDILPSLRIMGGFHYYFDKQATQEGNTQNYLKSGSRELLAGIEYDITKNIQISAGWQNTHFGTTDKYIRDVSFNVNSNSFGIGMGFQVAKQIKINVAYFHSVYGDYNRYTDDYNGISNTLATALNDEQVESYIESGAISGSDIFTRKNKVFGIGFDFSF